MMFCAADSVPGTRWMCVLWIATFALAPIAGADLVFNENFNGTPVGTLIQNGATPAPYYGAGVLHLTDLAAGQNNFWTYDPGQVLSSFDFRCDVLIGGGTGADGFCFSYSDGAGLGNGEEGDDTPGLAVRFPTYARNYLEVRYNGAAVGTPVALGAAVIRQNAFVPLNVRVSTTGAIQVWYNRVRYLNTTLPGWNPQSGWKLILSARTGGSNDNHWVDNISLRSSAPSVASITRVNANPVGGLVSQVRYDVLFNEAVQNVDATDFALTTTGGATATLTSVSTAPTRIITTDQGVFEGSTYYTGNIVHLTDATNSIGGWYNAPPEAFEAFAATFDLYIGGGSGADGCCFYYTNAHGPGAENGLGGPGVTISFDTYENGGEGSPRIMIMQNGAILYQASLWPLRTASWIPVRVTVSRQGLCSVFHNESMVGSAYLSNWSPQLGWFFGFSARSGGLNDNHYVRDINITNSKYSALISNMGNQGTMHLDTVSGNNIIDYWNNDLLPKTFTAGQIYDIDYVPTGVTLSSTAGSVVKTAIPVTVVLSESVTTFDVFDITPLNATISSFTGSGANYSFTLTPGSNGLFSAFVDAGRFTDAAGTGNALSNTLSRTYDTIAPGISLTCAAANPVNGAISVTATVTESVTTFDAADITFANASISGFTGSGKNYSFTLTPTTDGVFSAAVAAGKFADDAGNLNTAAPSAITRTYDGIKPIVTLASSAGNPVNGAITVTVTVSETTMDFVAADITPVNGTVSNFTGSNMTYSFTLTPGTNGAFSASVPAGKCSDSAGNTNDASNTISRVYDGSKPVLTLSCSAGEPVNGAITISVSVSEDVTTFIGTDIATNNALVSGFTGNLSSYSFTLTPQTPGAFSAWVPGGNVTDSAGNANDISNAISRTFDNVRPGVTLSCAAPDPVKNAVTVTVSLTESVVDFDAGDLSVNNASVNGFSGSGDTYSFILTPISEGAFSVWVGANVFIDSAGNQNLLSNTISRMYDSQDPGISLACTAGDPVKSPVTVTVSLTENVSSFDSADISRVNATIANFTGSGNSYTFTLVPISDGEFSAAINAGVFDDAAGNFNTASNNIVRVYDGTPPDVTLTCTASNPVHQGIAVQVEISESVSAFDAGDITVNNASVTAFSGNANAYSFTLTPVVDGQFSATVHGSVFTDPAGNANNASGTVTRTFDGTPPALQTRVPASGATVSSLSSVSVIFTEAVSGVDAAAFSVNGEPAATVTGTDEGPYVFSGFTAPGNGVATMLLAGAAIQDAAGNHFADDTWTYTVDSFLPTILLTSATVNDGGLTNAAVVMVTATFSQGVSGFTAGDVQVSNAAVPVGNFSGSGSVYTFSVSPLADGPVTVRVPQNAATGNNAPFSPSAASSIFQFTYDHTAPVIVLNGNDSVAVDCGDGYADPGVASATDNIDGDLTTFVVIGGDVINEFAPPQGGPYAITYSVTDQAGNTALRTRTVQVTDNCPLTVLADGNTMVSANEGGEVVLRVAVFDAIGEAHYDWQKEDGSKAFSSLGAPDGPGLILAEVDAADAGSYRCQVTDAVTIKTSPVFQVQLNDGTLPLIETFGIAALTALTALAGGWKARRKRS